MLLAKCTDEHSLTIVSRGLPQITLGGDVISAQSLDTDTQS